MGFNDGQIILNSTNGTYFPGQTVQARLVFQQDKVKKFRGIYAKIKGKCKVHWTTSHTRKGRDGHSETYHVTHESHEEYINQKVYLVGGESGEHEIGAGNHDYSFQFMLPHNIPSSFEGSYGHIRYSLQVVVDRAFKLDQELTETIRVVVPIDLNIEPYCKEPMQFEFQDSYCCCCMSSGSAETVVKLPVSGYCPGQIIPVEVASQNSGSVEIDNIKLIIKKHITFRATTNPDEKHTEDVIAEIKKGPVPENTSRNWNVEMAVPDVDILNVSACRYIDVDYEFVVKVCPGGCHSDTEGSRRLVIGTVPLVGYQDNVPNPQQDQMPMITVTNVTQGLPSYPSSTPYPIPNNPIPGGNPQYPGANPQYPVGNSYPTSQTYPGTVPNSPYPTNQQNTGINSSYPGPILSSPGAMSSINNTSNPSMNPPYPNVTPYPTERSPFLSNTPFAPTTPVHPPYPVQSSPYPSNMQHTSPYPVSSTPEHPPYPTTNTPSSFPNNPASPYPPQASPNMGTGLKAGTIGFISPLASQGPVSPAAPNPYQSASAPPDSPDK
ncbi:arrestin domain-containing protein 17-like isoform X1 [Leptidea sinapis]|uniref:arrestin domain-containing protein 17-like isoform X1 n=1 Tax=Leptidea sinapis TaxID=189913 RepID=UPI002137F4C2|nr:arrestin domain-containing protein 17-like isoform X1 [Leptidea sinapis]XP_050679386.1 arrestin domain-containing protein 17-like isoform X1 [Leptidea sinapis]